MEDAAEELEPGQMRKSEFIAALRGTVAGARSGAAAAAGWPAEQLAWSDQWLGFLAGLPAEDIVGNVAQYAPGASGATTATALLAAASAHLRTQVDGFLAAWNPVIAAESAQQEQAEAGIGGTLLKGDEGRGRPADDPVAALDELGPGQALPTGVRARMARAFGRDFPHVRLHRDATADRMAGHMKARAFTIGEHVGFRGGEFNPGSPVGDALLAHELAHVGQQDHAGDPATKSMETAERSGLEADADRAAVAATVRLWDGTGSGLAEMMRTALPRLRTGLRLQRCSCASESVPTLEHVPVPPVPVVRPPDQHSGVQVPDPAAQRAIMNELMPGRLDPAPPPPSSGGPAPAPVRPTVRTWRGSEKDSSGTLTPAAQRERRRLGGALRRALINHLNGRIRGIRAESRRYATRRVPMTTFVGPGEAAKRVVDAQFGSYGAAAALSGPQARNRAAFAFSAAGPGRNLLDAYSRADRALVNMAVSAEAVLWWMVQRDRAADLQNAVNFVPRRGSDEEAWLASAVITPLATGPRRADLELYDQFGFAITSETATGESRIVLPSTLPEGLSTDAPATGGPSPAERAARWEGWKTLVHEYIHTLEHPTYSRAKDEASGVLTEGVTEYLTKQVLDTALPTVAGDAALRASVEGEPGLDPPGPDILATTYPYNSGYAQDVSVILRILPHVGDAGLKAAYFQGHVEYLGLTPTGGLLTPVAAGTGGGITVPAGVSSLAALATRTGVSEEDLRAANPDLPVSGTPLPSRVNVPGWREHIVVEAVDLINATTTPETKAQIAAQNGLVESDLDPANPGVNWTGLSAGDRILIPPV